MPEGDLSIEIIQQIETTVTAYVGRREDFFNFAGRVERDLVENQRLRPLISLDKAQREGSCSFTRQAHSKGNEGPM